VTNADSHVETLEKLGLTQLQAKIYLATVTLQRATSGKIATIANVARPDVYRILPSLEKIGLLRKVITSPVMYEATPIKEGCDILLERKKEEYTSAENDTLKLITEFHQKPPAHEDNGINEGFLLLTSKELLIDKIVASDSSVKMSIDIIGRWEAIRPVIYKNRDIYSKQVKRGVRIRVITNKPETSDQGSLILNKKLGPLFEIRYLDEALPIKGAIYDCKSANMCVRKLRDQELTPCLWSTNPEFVKVMASYFENIWAKTKSPTV
jgi:sugar-specific transcriptional regulator TrmB